MMVKLEGIMTDSEIDHLTPAQRARLDRHTEIVWNELEEEATLETPNPKEWRRLEKLGCIPIYQNKHIRRYRVPKEWIKFSPRRKYTVTDSEKQRRKRSIQKAREGLAQKRLL